MAAGDFNPRIDGIAGTENPQNHFVAVRTALGDLHPSGLDQDHSFQRSTLFKEKFVPPEDLTAAAGKDFLALARWETREQPGIGEGSDNVARYRLIHELQNIGPG